MSIGTDCATHRDVITGKVEKSDVILTGSKAQLIKIADKLKHQPFRLSILGKKIAEQINIQNNKSTKLAGILNVTPDSFSDGGKYYKLSDAQKHVMQMIEDGADLIDIGAESTRPNANDVTAKEQIRRLKPILNFIQNEKPDIKVSVDTRSSEVADFVLNNGANIINDVSGFVYDDKMPDIISKYNAGVVIQHSKDCPQTMQNNPVYENVAEEVYKFLMSKIKIAEEFGIKEIIVDPGIGFGKTREHNFEILERIEEFYSLGCPVMVGISRKSLLGISDNNNELKDTLSTVLSYPLVQKGVDYLRVHNIKLHKHMLNLIQ